MKDNEKKETYIIMLILIAFIVIVITVCQNTSGHQAEALCNCGGSSELEGPNAQIDYSSSITEPSESSDISDVTAEKDLTSSSTLLADETPLDNNNNKMFEIGESVPLPSLPTNYKAFTDYRSYKLQQTPHYRLQQAAYTDSDGLRRFNEDYIVAMGPFYAIDIVERFKVTLDTGIEFTVITGDSKAPAECDKDNMYAPCINYDGENCANVLEFIVDSDVMSKEVYGYGSIDYIEFFKGNITKMVYLGRDTSADWTSYE